MASMRPGQTAPECAAQHSRYMTIDNGFNEAGADCPGMRPLRGKPRRKLPGADCPGMRFRITIIRINEAGASMRPGQTAPECHAITFLCLRRQTKASMRPGQTAPECIFVPASLDEGQRSFNEAGADCPGMQRLVSALTTLPRSFNEAGADCPGMPRNPAAARDYAERLQ